MKHNRCSRCSEQPFLLLCVFTAQRYLKSDRLTSQLEQAYGTKCIYLSCNNSYLKMANILSLINELHPFLCLSICKSLYQSKFECSNFYMCYNMLNVVTFKGICILSNMLHLFRLIDRCSPHFNIIFSIFLL